MKNLRPNTREYDVFGSYPERLLPRLKELAATTLARNTRWFIHERNGNPTIAWREELDRQLQDCLLMVFIVDKAGPGEEQKNELDVFLNLKKPVIVLSLDPIRDLKANSQRFPSNLLDRNILFVDTSTPKETQARIDCEIEDALRRARNAEQTGSKQCSDARIQSAPAASGEKPMFSPKGVKWLSGVAIVGIVMSSLSNADCSHQLIWHGASKRTELEKTAGAEKQRAREKKADSQMLAVQEVGTASSTHNERAEDTVSQRQTEPNEKTASSTRDEKAEHVTVAKQTASGGQGLKTARPARQVATASVVKAESPGGWKPAGTTDVKRSVSACHQAAKQNVSSHTLLSERCQTDDALKAIEGECLDAL